MRYDLRDPKILSREAEAAGHGLGTIRREPIMLDPSMTIAEAFVAVTRGCVTHIVTAAEAARRTDDPESIHQLRVGIRRLRAAFSVFSPALPPRPAIVNQLRALQERLGTARDIDVLYEEMVASMPHDLRNRRGMRELTQAVQIHRIASHRRARMMVASRRCSELLSHLGTSMECYVSHPGGSAAATRMDQPITGFAVELLESRLRKARKLGDDIRDLDRGELHKLRIRIKKLRYSVEFFRDLESRARIQPYLRALKDLQQLLGMTHDAVVASSLIAEIGKRGGPAPERAAVVAQDWANACFKRAERKLPGAWRRFIACKSPWKSGRKPRPELRKRSPGVGRVSWPYADAFART